jgi:hypothetical protein
MSPRVGLNGVNFHVRRLQFGFACLIPSPKAKVQTSLPGRMRPPAAGKTGIGTKNTNRKKKKEYY